MLRLLPLVAFALVPSVIAAPIPHDVQGGELGANGVLTRTDLEKVKFDTRRYTGTSDKFAKLANVKHDYDLAIHLPRTKFREGDSMPAYFVARNNLDRGLPLVDYPQLFGAEPILTDDCDIYVVDKATGNRVGGPRLRANYQRKRSGHEVIPAKGYYVTKADLAGMGGQSLPVGEYEVQWRYATWDGQDTHIAAAPVTFTIEKVRGTKPKFTKQPDVHFFEISPHSDHEPLQPFVWNHCKLMNVHEVAQVLGIGRNGVYVPDVYSIPATYNGLTISVQWKPYRNEDRLAVTLESVWAEKQVRFAQLPNFYLQAVIPSESTHNRRARAKPEVAIEVDSKKLVTPLTIEMRLPDDWREQLEATTSARVAVVAASESLTWKHAEAKKTDEKNPVWNGVLRTKFVELQFLPTPPLNREPE